MKKDRIQDSAFGIREMGFAIRSSFMVLLVFTVLLGVVYPLVVMGVAQVAFPKRSHGSLIEKNGKVIGSRLLGQQFDSPKYFWGRLSATTPPYNPAASSGSNMNPANPALLAAAQVRIDALHKADPANKEPIPVDLVTSSASGVDPHISYEAAEYQVARVAGARNMKTENVEAVIRHHTQAWFFGAFGEAYVNVLAANMELDGK